MESSSGKVGTKVRVTTTRVPWDIWAFMAEFRDGVTEERGMLTVAEKGVEVINGN